jgi:two-component system, NarL family, nitrate/nitrite response regulator NarL
MQLKTIICQLTRIAAKATLKTCIHCLADDEQHNARAQRRKDAKRLSSCRPIRILIGGTQSILRAGLRKLLDGEDGFAVAGEAPDLVTAIHTAADAGAGIVLGDFECLRKVEPEALSALADRQGACTILLADPETDRGEVAAALRMGARGVVWRDAGARVLAEAIRSVVRGNIWVGRESIAHLDEALLILGEVDANPGRQKTYGMTPRELEIMAKIVSGYSNKEIAKKLSISQDTVKHHVTNIYDKVGVYNRLELALFAIHHGLVKKK